MVQKKNLIFIFVIFVLLSCNRPLPLELQNRPPIVPTDIFPKDDTTNVELVITFNWEAGDPNNNDQLFFDFYFGTSEEHLVLMASELETKNFVVDSLNTNTLYYWKIIAKDEQGLTAEGPVWKFITRSDYNNSPNIPDNPLPENNEQDVIIDNTILHWKGGDPDKYAKVTYDIYFGTHADSLNLVSECQSDTFYSPGVLEFARQYFWKVISQDQSGLSSESPVWSFITQNKTLLFGECFDFYNQGTIYSNDIWTVMNTNANIYISDSVSFNEAGKSLCFIDSSEAGYSLFATRLNTRAVGMLQFYCKIISKKDVFGFRMYSENPVEERIGPQVSFREGSLQYYDNTYNWVSILPVELDKWYFIKIYFNCHDGYFSIYVDNELKIERATWTGQKVPTLDLIYFMTFNNKLCKAAYLDEIKYFSGSN